ncbi:MAG: Fumarate reductase membrane anchor subunit FrdC, partial [uncultured Nocardioidaceae bacterium]
EHAHVGHAGHVHASPQPGGTTRCLPHDQDHRRHARGARAGPLRADPHRQRRRRDRLDVRHQTLVVRPVDRVGRTPPRICAPPRHGRHGERDPGPSPGRPLGGALDRHRRRRDHRALHHRRRHPDLQHHRHQL